jgi:pyrimidine operon attenuation protein/uracil phosphoribosyltransferase
MSGELGTTNILLGIMAAVSVLEALVIIGIGVGGLLVYRRVMTLIEGLEQRQVAPAMARVNAILDDVKGVSARMKEETERVDRAIRSTMDRVDDTADRVRTNVRAKTGRLVGFIRGVRVAIESMLEHREPRTQEHF